MKLNGQTIVNIILFLFLMIFILGIWMRFNKLECAIATKSNEESATTFMSTPTSFTASTVSFEIPARAENVIANEAVDNTVFLMPNLLEYIETTDKAELKNLINNCLVYKSNAHTMAESARALGYDETHPVILLAKEEWENINKLQIRYEALYEELDYAFWDRCMEEYPEATKVWLYLKNELGYNEYVCAGIIGNIMAECGGQSLNIDWDIYNRTGEYYGICQWSNKYYPEVHGTSLEFQCEFLRDTIAHEINMFGKLYEEDFYYEDFLALEDVYEAALCFAETYEKCGDRTYPIRQCNAEFAYEYFVVNRDK